MLLDAVTWKSASEKPLLFTCLIVGMILPVPGMLCRWISYQMEA